MDNQGSGTFDPSSSAARLLYRCMVRVLSSAHLMLILVQEDLGLDPKQLQRFKEEARDRLRRQMVHLSLEIASNPRVKGELEQADCQGSRMRTLALTKESIADDIVGDVTPLLIQLKKAMAANEQGRTNDSSRSCTCNSKALLDHFRNRVLAQLNTARPTGDHDDDEDFSNLGSKLFRCNFLVPDLEYIISSYQSHLLKFVSEEPLENPDE